LRGDKGVCSGNGEKTHPCPSGGDFFKELNSPAPQWRAEVRVKNQMFATLTDPLPPGERGN